MIETDLKVKDQFIGHRHVGYVRSDLPIEETPEPYTYEVKDHIVEDCGGWENLFSEPVEVVHPINKLLEGIKKYWKQKTKI